MLTTNKREDIDHTKDRDQADIVTTEEETEEIEEEDINKNQFTNFE